MSLAKGTRLGPYEIEAPIGAGGMGEVYAAHDPRLSRRVAIKVISAAMAADAQRVERFEQEARAAGGLNHPNVVTVYDVGRHEGTPYIVQELLDGETLHARCAREPLPPRRAAAIAAQIARGLAAAHDHGIVHRDLKPENVFLTADGGVKILDFGLAKLAGPVTPGSGPALTEAGQVLGTVGYMAPEQVRGRPVDHRADVFAFGAILFEMLTGERAFDAASAVESMNAILKGDPMPRLEARPGIAPGLVALVRRCLEKEPHDRFQSARDLAFAAESLSIPTGQQPSVTMPAVSAAVAAPARSPWGWIVAGVLAAALIAVLLRSKDAEPIAAASTVRFQVPLPEGASLQRLAFSPDGSRLAIEAVDASGNERIWIRELDGTALKPLPGAPVATCPLWSPDGRELSFITGDRMVALDLATGVTRPICGRHNPRSPGAWNAAGRILFADGSNSMISEVPAAGGKAQDRTQLAGQGSESAHRDPAFLPDGRRFLVRVLHKAEPGKPERDDDLCVASLDDDTRRPILSVTSRVALLRGHLLYRRGATLYAHPFDAERAVLTGDPIPVADDIAANNYAGSETGAIAFQDGAKGRAASRLVWFDRAGKETGTLGEPGAFGEVTLSRDGSQAAVTAVEDQRRQADLWIYDLRRGVGSRITVNESAYMPLWDPDGRSVAYLCYATATPSVLRRSADGQGESEVVLAQSATLDWSPDGNWLVCGSTGEGSETQSTAVAMRPGRTTFTLGLDPQHMRFSPDAKWIAFDRGVAGRVDVFAARFPDLGARTKVSAAGGFEPRWRGDGKELYFLDPERWIVAVDVREKDGALEFGEPHRLFRTRARVYNWCYDVTADGARFLVVEEMDPNPTPVTVVLNWRPSAKR